MPEIILKHITKRWGKFVGVDDLNLVIKDHAFVTLLGPSGCGKTTTLRMIAGLETPTSGEITIDGDVVFSSEQGINKAPNKRNVGFLFQNYALWPHMTVYKNIAFGLENLKWKKDQIKARVDELLKMLKIEEFVNRYPSELSGGQQQRVAIARTLAPNPKVLFMDEPLSNLDAKLRLEMRTELKRLHRETNSTFVYVTHDQLEAMTLATEVCLMEKGILQQYAPPLEVYAKPNKIFVADFVGNPTMNFIEAQATQTGSKELELKFEGISAKFVGNDEFELPKKEEDENIKPIEEVVIPSEEAEGEAKVESNLNNVIIGVRPEFITLSDTEGIDATIYSSLPSGMETIVNVKVGDDILTSVVFGIIDYKVDTPVKINFTGDKLVLFDKNSKVRLTDGSLNIVRSEKTKSVDEKAPKEKKASSTVVKKTATVKKANAEKKESKTKSATKSTARKSTKTVEKKKSK